MNLKAHKERNFVKDEKLKTSKMQCYPLSKYSNASKDCEIIMHHHSNTVLRRALQVSYCLLFVSEAQNLQGEY